MIPFTFPSQPSVVSGNAECKVWYLSSVVGMARWIDYIPVRQTATASPIEGRTDAGGYQAVTLLSSISGKQAWIDYVPVYEDSSATVAWGTGADGYIPVGSAGAALSLQMLGTNTLDPRITFTRASSGTHFDSTGRLVTDGNNVARFDYDPAVPAGVTGGELVTNGDFSNGTTGWTLVGAAVSGGQLVVGASVGSAFATSTTATFSLGKRYRITYTVVSLVGDSISAVIGGVVGTVRPTTAGTYTEDFMCTATGSFALRDRGAGITSAVIDNISVQEVTFTPRGLLIEEQRTNLLLHSRDMTQAAWSKTDVTAARTQVGIDGVASSACLMTEGSAGTAITTAGNTVTAGSTITGSIVFKRGNTDWVRIVLAGPGLTNGVDTWFNLNTGAKGGVTARGTGTSNSSTITSLGGGWYRCTATTVPDGSYTSANIGFMAVNADNSTTRVANATYIVDCAQLEVGAFATSPIITGAATATRAADSASMTGTNFSSWFNASAGTFVVEATPRAPSAFGTNQYVVGASDGTLNNRVAIFRNSVTGVAAFRVASGVSQLSASASSLPTDVVAKLAVTYGGSASVGVSNGATTAAGGATAPASVSVCYIGQSEIGGSNYFNGHLLSLRYYNTRLPNAQLTALTA